MTLWQEVPWANVLTLKIVLPLWFHQLPFALTEKGGLLGSFSDAFSNWRDIIAKETPSCKAAELPGPEWRWLWKHKGWRWWELRKLESAGHPEYGVAGEVLLWELSLLVSGECGLEREGGHCAPRIPPVPRCCPAGAAGLVQSWELPWHGMGTICWCHVSSLPALCSQACCWLCKKPAKARH